jgi:hypothetical protein
MALVWCVREERPLPSIYSKAMVGSSICAHATVIGETTRKHHMEGEARQCSWGCRRTLGTAIPRRGLPTTAFLWSVVAWA